MQAFRLRSAVIREVRQFLEAIHLEEVRVPLLVPSGAMEPFLDALSVNANNRRYGYLPTSPEFALKKALALTPKNVAGVYSVAPAFRDDEKSNLHAREFTMAEWYIRHFDYLNFYEQINSLLKRLSQKYPDYLKCPVNHAMIPVADVFQRFFHGTNRAEFPAGIDRGYYSELMQENGIQHPVLESDYEFCSMAFHLLLENIALPALRKEYQLFAVYGFPSFSRGMANLNVKKLAMRMEVYLNGIEIANGYSEMHDPAELLSLWKKNNAVRAERGKEIHPVDDTLIELTPAMQGVAGIAVGIERLIMGMGEVGRIQDFDIH